MTWYEWSCKASGYTINQCKEWERARFIAYMVYVMNAYEKKFSEQDLRPLMTDPEKQAPKKVTREDIEEMKRKANERAMQIMQK